jgi:hypothetical protein
MSERDRGEMSGGMGEASLAGVTMLLGAGGALAQSTTIRSQGAATTESGRRSSACDGTITIPENE